MSRLSARRAVRGVVIAVAVAVVTLELTALLVLLAAGVYPTASFRELYASSSCLQASEFNYGKQAQWRRDPRDPGDTQVMLRKVPHPFFGFTMNAAFVPAEHRDLLIDADFENELRYRRMLGDDGDDEPFTIGIFGASVALALGDHVLEHEAFRERLRQSLPFLHDRQIRIRNMAIGSSRQPTQMAIATHYMELFDMTINLDGYSEMAVDQYPDYPIEFPMFSDVFYSTDSPGRYLWFHAAAEVCRVISEIPRTFPPLAFSHAYYLAWYNASQRMLAALYGPPAEGARRRAYPFDDEEVRELYAAYYAKFTRYQHQILAANGVRSYFFLQPNQYVEGSKRFTKEELRDALGYRDSEEIGARYQRFREQVRALQADGVSAFDLTMLFADVDETIYVDACCHVNERGNALLAAHIAETIIREELGRLSSPTIAH